MKLLSEDTKVVNALKRILLEENYFYLEYNESKSAGDVLYVDVIDDKPDCANMDRERIVGELEKRTGRFFNGKFHSGPINTRRGNLDKQWGYLRIRERKKP